MEFQLWSETETIHYRGQDVPVDFSAKEVLLSCLPPIAKGNLGYTLDDMKIRNEAVKALEKAEDTVVLNLQATGLILKRMGLMQFPVVSDNLQKLRDNLNQHYVELSQHKR